MIAARPVRPSPLDKLGMRKLRLRKIVHCTRKAPPAEILILSLSKDDAHDSLGANPGLARARDQWHLAAAFPKPLVPR